MSALTRLTTVRATYDCAYWPEGEEDDYPATWSGWCDPRNPWGTADDTYHPDYAGSPDAGEPIAETMTLREAAQLVRDFPGAVWDFTECEPGENYRSGVSTSVTLHLGEHAEIVLELARRWYGVRGYNDTESIRSGAG